MRIKIQSIMIAKHQVIDDTISAMGSIGTISDSLREK